MSATDPAVAAAISGWCPTSLPEPAASFARLVVTMAAPGSAARARALLWACGQLAVFADTVGLPLEPQRLLVPSVIERCVLVGRQQTSRAVLRTLRSNLRWVATRVAPGGLPQPARLPREPAKAPYSATQIAAYLALADAQPTVSRRMRLSALICLGAGAGVVGSELRGLTGTHVLSRSGGLLVEVGGRRPRTVPVLASYQQRLQAAAEHAGTASLIGGASELRRNLTTPLLRSVAGGADLPPLSTSRLRSTWLTDCARQLGLGAFMTAAGIVCSQRLGDLIATLPPVPEDQAVALLGAARGIEGIGS